MRNKEERKQDKKVSTRCVGDEEFENALSTVSFLRGVFGAITTLTRREKTNQKEGQWTTDSHSAG